MNSGKPKVFRNAAVIWTISLIAGVNGPSLSMAGEYFFPPWHSRTVLQTNGPQSDLESGDWWSHANNGLGSQPHVYELYVPAAVDPAFVVALQICDPECYLTFTEKDQKNGATWDIATFTLISPDHQRVVVERSYPPSPETSCLWTPFAALTAGEFGHGVYRLQVRTSLDDKNAYAFKITNNDPDGIPNSGDEIHLAAKQTALLQSATGPTWFSFYASAEKPLLLANFDADQDSIWAYLTPDGQELAGTESADGLWSDGSVALPPPGGDWFERPTSGWWQAQTIKTYGNQYTFYCGMPFLIDTTLSSPELAISMEDGVTAVEGDQILTYQIRVLNKGQGSALAVTVIDTLPAGFFITQKSAGAILLQTADRSILSWRFNRLRPGEQLHLFLSAQVQNPPGPSLEHRLAVHYTDVLYTPYDPVEAVDENALHLPGEISGWVWRDQNYDGLRGGNEPGLANVQLLLLNSRGDTVRSAVSGRDGGYFFPSLTTGTYRILVNPATLPSMMSPTVVVQPHSFPITAIGEQYQDINFGFELGITPVEISVFTLKALIGAVQIQWTSESETANLGYHILRSSAKNGDYSAVNQEIIPGSGDSQQPHTYQFTDETVEPGAVYFYLLEAIDYQGHRTHHGPQSVTVLSAPETFCLEQNYPNPFNGETRIDYRLKQDGFVDLSIYNLLGQKIRTLVAQTMQAGAYSVRWDGRNEQQLPVPSGVYFYILQTDGFKQSRKMQYVK